MENKIDLNQFLSIPYDDYTVIKSKVLDRDQYKCIYCGTTKNLIMHHKDNSRNNGKPINNNINNLIILCHYCHAKAHIELIKRLIYYIRLLSIKYMYSNKNMTQNEIAKYFNVTRQRIQQITHKYNFRRTKMGNTKVITILKDVIGAKSLYKFGTKEQYTFALKISKDWINNYGLYVDDKMWVVVIYFEDKIVIKPVDAEKLKDVVNLSVLPNEEIDPVISKL